MEYENESLKFQNKKKALTHNFVFLVNLKMTFKSIGFLTVPLHSKLFLAAKVFVHRKIAFTQVKIYSISKLESLKSFSEQEKVYLEFFLLKCFLFCSKKKMQNFVREITFVASRIRHHKICVFKWQKNVKQNYYCRFKCAVITFYGFVSKKKLSICVLRFVRTFSICRCYYF